MKKKKGIILFIQVAGSIVGILLELFIFIKIMDRIGPDRPVQNVFDEMIVNDARALRNSANICNVENHRPHENYMRMEYKDIDENISSDIFIYFDDSAGLTKAAPIYILFSVHDEEENKSEFICFVYYEKVKKLFVYGFYSIQGKKEPMSWGKFEYYRDYLLYDIIIGSHLDNRISRFSMDNLGEFEIIDYLLPYEYCGMPEREISETDVDEQGVSYITWLDTGSLLCIQQKIQHEIQQEIQYDNRRMLHVVFGNIPCMLTDEVFGRYTGVSRFVVQIDGKDCELSDLIEINDDFIEWIKSSGQAQGNLHKTSPNREAGCIKTQQMLQNFPEEQMRAVLENCEFYIEPGYLHIRLPYWDYELKEPGFVMNGEDLWRGWLTMKTDDIEGFLKVEKW